MPIEFLSKEETPEELAYLMVVSPRPGGKYVAIKAQLFNYAIIICDEGSIFDYW